MSKKNFLKKLKNMTPEKHRKITDNATDLQVELAIQHVFFLAHRIMEYVRISTSYQALPKDFQDQMEKLEDHFNLILSQFVDLRNHIVQVTGESSAVEDNAVTIVAILERARDITWFHARVTAVLESYHYSDQARISHSSDQKLQPDIIPYWYELFCNALHLLKGSAQSGFFQNVAARYQEDIRKGLMKQYKNPEGISKSSLSRNTEIQIGILGGFDPLKSTLSAWLSDSPDLFSDIPEYRGMAYGGILALLQLHDDMTEQDALPPPSVLQLENKEK